MSRCTHKHFTLEEHLNNSNFYEFEDGNPPKDGRTYMYDDPEPTGFLSVNCFDCGFERHYTPKSKRAKWVEDAWKALKEELEGVPELD